MIPIVEESALRAALTPADAVRVIRDAFRADGAGRTHVPPVINLEVPHANGEFHIKTAHIDNVPYVAVKVASGFYDNPARGLPSGSGLILLFDASTGLPAAMLLDNAFLTDIRTGAAGAVAADVLARANIEVVGVLGAGIQARHQIRCLAEVRSFRHVVAWSRSRERLDEYCADMRREGHHTIAAASAEEVCGLADVLVTTTPARAPLVRAKWLRPGVHVTAVGSDSAGKQELEAACLQRADVVVADRMSQCAAFGELRHAMDADLIAKDAVSELGAVVVGRARGRADDGQITIADLTGVGFQDTAIASYVFQEVAARS